MANRFLTPEGLDSAAVAKATGYGQLLTLTALQRIIARTGYTTVVAMTEIDLLLAVVLEQETILWVHREFES